MPPEHLLQSEISSNPGVTFCSLTKDGEGGWNAARAGTIQGVPPRAMHELQAGALPTPHLQKAFASNVLEQIELEPNKAVVICKLEMLQRAQD